MTADIVIYHNPECGTSRNALAMIRNAGIEPHVIEYLMGHDEHSHRHRPGADDVSAAGARAI